MNQTTKSVNVATLSDDFVTSFDKFTTFLSTLTLFQTNRYSDQQLWSKRLTNLRLFQRKFSEKVSSLRLFPIKSSEIVSTLRLFLMKSPKKSSKFSEKSFSINHLFGKNQRNTWTSFGDFDLKIVFSFDNINGCDYICRGKCSRTIALGIC